MAFKHGGDTLDTGLCEVEGNILGETIKAVRFTDGGAPQWFPRSKIRIEQRRDGKVAIFLPEWLAREKGYV